MKKKQLLTLLLFAFALLSYGTIPVPFNQKNITYMGRIGMESNQYAELYWPGSSISINFKGTEIKGTFKNVKEETYFFVIVDGDDSNPVKIKPDTIKSTIVLAKGLKNKKHTLQVFKLTNNTTFSRFYGFELADGSKILPASPLPKRKIEFYGNSITAGHGVDVKAGNPDSGSSALFNNYWTYAARTARHYHSQYSCIARSGIGIMVSWFPEIMPEIYDRTNPDNPQSKWDFSKYTPDIVVINLFQNDSWIVKQPNNAQFKARFGTTAPDEAFIIKSYQDFVKSIRSKYPKASIICALGSMDATKEGSPWPGYVEKASKGLNDPKIYTYFFPFKNTPGHPIVAEQKVMADGLIKFIDEHIKW
ncbi:SGNH/GDSL hydrolase family protein [Parabacteroides sp. FAFU027]|uniref:SGNH/GDSL hydrolase family protein n=1 Tax=Parabacteroides sp. FAFU027 TaxID=2922715 RepID=UPI001FAF8DA9|nr:SGNH/GDSL hydrolase family protein [Parabacteroides sp. FAFU027]